MKTTYAIIIFALIVLAFFHDVLVGSNVFLTANPAHYDPWKAYASDEDLGRNTYWEDPLLTYLPRRMLLRDAVRSGRLPLWNPYIYSGTPFLADPQSRVFYPIEILLTAMDPVRAMAYDAAIHVFLAMLGMYLFLRRVGVGARGSILGACAYAFSSFFYFRYAFPTLVASAAWIPFHFYGFEVAWRSPRKGTLLLTIFFTLGYLAGFPQVFLFGICAVAFYAIYVGLSQAAGSRITSLFRVGKVFAISGLLAALLVSVQLIPFFELYRNSFGLRYPADYLLTVFVTPPVILLRTVFPGFFGNPIDGTSWSDLSRHLIHPYNPDFAFFCGAGALLLGLVALHGIRRSPRVRALIVVFVLSVWVAISRVMLKLAYYLLPMFNASRPDRVCVLACFALSAMAGIGFSMISRDRARVRRHLRIVVLIVLGFVLITILGLELAGEAVFENLAERVRSFPDEHWSLISNYTRSGGVKEWVEGDLAGWISYERGQVWRGAFAAGLSAVLILLWAASASSKRRLRWGLGLIVVLVVMADVTMVARSYYLTQPAQAFRETEGIKHLRSLLADEGRWRIRSARQTLEDDLAFPANINQVFRVHSAEGKGTLFPEAYNLLRYHRKHLEGTIDKPAAMRPWLASPADDIMCVRFLVARQREPRFSYRPLFRYIAAARGQPSPLKMLELDGDNRLALCQEAGEFYTFDAAQPPTSTLSFELGFTSDTGSPGDSVFFRLVGEGKSGRLFYSKGFDLRADRGRWHPAEVELAPLRGGGGPITTSWVLPESAEAVELTGGLSRPEHVVMKRLPEPVPEGYEVDVTSRGGALSLEIESPAKEVPLEIIINEGPLARRWITFPHEAVSRSIWIDLRGRRAMRAFIKSDSAFTIIDCRQVWVGWPKTKEMDCELIHDEDMCIYENTAAIEKGICLDMACFGEVRGVPPDTLALSAISDIDSARCGECAIVSYRPEEVVLEVEADKDCYLVLQDMYYPGWKAYVDGMETVILKTDIGIRALELGQGAHRVTMAFKPTSLKIGLVLTCIGLGLTLLFSCGKGLPAFVSLKSEKAAAPKGHH